MRKVISMDSESSNEVFGVDYEPGDDSIELFIENNYLDESLSYDLGVSGAVDLLKELRKFLVTRGCGYLLAQNENLDRTWWDIASKYYLERVLVISADEDFNKLSSEQQEALIRGIALTSCKYGGLFVETAFGALVGKMQEAAQKAPVIQQAKGLIKP